MLLHLIEKLAIFTFFVISLALIIGQITSVGVSQGHIFWLPIISILSEFTDISSSIFNVFPVFLILSYICLLAAGLLSLLEMD